MAVSFEQFFKAIAQQESGGNYQAVGEWVRDPKTGKLNRAYGKYQVMDFNIASWTKKYLGYSLTPQQFLNADLAQEAVAIGVLKDYYNKYGAEGAAAMWYSGQSNPNKTYGKPPVNVYVQQVMQKAGGSFTGSGGGSSGGGSGGGGGAGTTPKLSDSELAAQYGFSSAMLNSIPELKSLFKQAVSGGWSSDKFKAKLQDTKWWKTHSQKQQQFLIQQFTDPASNAKFIADTKFRINEMAAQLGVLGSINNAGFQDEFVFQAAYQGWSDQEIRYRLADYINFTPEGTLGGASGQMQMKLASLAYANGIKVDSNFYLNWARSIARGSGTIEQAEREIRNQAAAAFSGFREQILAGQNVAELAAPYFQSMGQILEIDANALDLFDPQIRGALNYKDPKTGATGAQPLWDWEVKLKKDPRWLKTNNAREGIMGIAHTIGQQFGMAW